MGKNVGLEDKYFHPQVILFRVKLCRMIRMIFDRISYKIQLFYVGSLLQTSFYMTIGFKVWQGGEWFSVFHIFILISNKIEYEHFDYLILFFSPEIAF